MVKVNKIEAAQADSLNQKEAFFLKYKKTILIAVVAIIVIIAGAICYHSYVAVPAENEASTKLAEGQQYMLSGQLDKALKSFESVASDYSSTDAGNLANLYAGLCYAHQEKANWKKALEYVEKYDGGDDMIISPAAKMALGDIYANNDQLDNAVSAFKKAAEMANSEAADGINLSIAPLALRKAGIILEKQGKKEEANKIYTEIKSKYVNAATYQDIDKYIERTATAK